MVALLLVLCNLMEQLHFGLAFLLGDFMQGALKIAYKNYVRGLTGPYQAGKNNDQILKVGHRNQELVGLNLQAVHWPSETKKSHKCSQN